MAVVIAEVVTEVVVAPAAAPGGRPSSAGGTLAEDEMEALVRRAAERVLETLRREWDR